METKRKLIDVEQVNKKATANGVVGIILNILMAIGVFASLDRKYGLMIGITVLFLALLVLSIRTMDQLYEVKFNNPEEFEKVNTAFHLNIVNLIFMSIGGTITSFWLALALDF